MTFAFQLLNDGAPVDLTGDRVTLAVATANKQTFSKDCTITNATMGQFEVLLDSDMYYIVGDYSAQIYWFHGAEINITDKFYYESVSDIVIL